MFSKDSFISRHLSYMQKFSGRVKIKIYALKSISQTLVRGK